MGEPLSPGATNGLKAVERLPQNQSRFESRIFLWACHPGIDSMEATVDGAILIYFHIFHQSIGIPQAATILE